MTAAPLLVGAEHAVALAAIHQAAFPPADAWSVAAFAAQLDLPGVFALLDPAGGLLLGRVAADEAELLTFAVVPAARRRGHGRGLLRAAMALAAAAGARAMFLEVGSANDAALALYRSAGFAAVGRRRNYYGEAVDAVVLRAALTAPAAAEGC